LCKSSVDYLSSYNARSRGSDLAEKKNEMNLPISQNHSNASVISAITSFYLPSFPKPAKEVEKLANQILFQWHGFPTFALLNLG
jgi:hypothetical protein